MIAMPPDFRYRDVFLKGKPQHDLYDTFRIRHPKMANGRRAKIFSPFDALKGFSEAISSKEVIYMDRIEPDQEQKRELNRRLTILHELTINGRMARKNRVCVKVTYYEPCMDVYSDAYGYRGRYRTIDGICQRVDQEISHTICIDGVNIEFDSILRIENLSGIFDPEQIKKEIG